MTQGDEKLTKTEAADYIGVSVRTLLRLTGKRIAHLPKRRSAEETLYSRAELDRYQSEVEREAAGVVVSGVAVAPGTRVTSVTPDTRALQAVDQSLMPAVPGMPSVTGTPDADGASIFQARMLAALEAIAATVKLTDKMTLNLVEAAQVSGLSRNHLREAIHAGKLKAKIIGRGWKVKRTDLDAYVRKL